MLKLSRILRLRNQSFSCSQLAISFTTNTETFGHFKFLWILDLINKTYCEALQSKECPLFLAKLQKTHCVYCLITAKTVLCTFLFKCKFSFPLLLINVFLWYQVMILASEIAQIEVNCFRSYFYGVKKLKNPSYGRITAFTNLFNKGILYNLSLVLSRRSQCLFWENE